jgi:hypothetical protein
MMHHFTTSRWRHAPLVAVLAVLVGCQPPADGEDQGWTPPALTGDVDELPDGREVVQRMIDFMQEHQEVAFEARVTWESVQASGQKLHFDMLQRVAIRKPDQIFWVTLRDDASVDSAWYNNNSFSMIRQPANIWAQTRIPGDMADMVEELVNGYQIDVPFPDILSGNPQELWLGDDISSVWYVGEAWVGGYWTDHVAIREPGADIQIWIRQGDEPFPARVVVIFVEDEGMPVNIASFTKWSTTLPADPMLFQFTPPPEADRIDVVPAIRQ